VASAATALTPLAQANASPESMAARRGLSRPCATHTSGTSTHGATQVGSASTEIGPSVVIRRGLSAKANAASTRASGVPMPSSPVRRMTPRNATTSRTDSQSRCTTHGSSPARLPAAKNGPTGHAYPYAWFCTCPKKPSGSHIWIARARKPTGLIVRSSLLSGVTRPGTWKNASAVSAAQQTASRRRQTAMGSAAAGSWVVVTVGTLNTPSVRERDSRRSVHGRPAPAPASAAARGGSAAARRRPRPHRTPPGPGTSAASARP